MAGALLSPAVICTAIALVVLAQSPAIRTPRDLLRDIASVTDAEWAAIQRGEVFARTLDTDNRQVAVVGVVRIAASPDPLVARYRNIENLERSRAVIAVGRFGAHPQASDLANVPFEEYGLDLRDCRPSDCRVRLSAEDIERFHRTVDWRAPDWKVRSAAVWRDVLAGHAAAYKQSGRIALPVFANKREPLRVADEVSALVSQMDFLRDYSPELYAYMREFAPPAPAGSEHTFYWSKEDFGIRPVLRMSHQVLHAVEKPRAIIIVTNQIYADHYLDGAISVTLAIDGSDGPRSGSFYLVSISRARTRSLEGTFRAFVRSTVRGRSRDALRKILENARAQLESAAKSSKPGG